ncbi:class I SAM-dependent methyltransferase, partial [Pseudomonas syringae pv. tagetis]|uniref:class I SAM-dependent methyltransferase n=1 Tax=Pseudomonas syringae group genomosp. 7 TaxID=251699 RepID=UPI00376FC3E3
STPSTRPPATGEPVMDVGCRAGGHVLGVDIYEPLICRARALAPKDTQELFLVADARSDELPEGAF